MNRDDRSTPNLRNAPSRTWSASSALIALGTVGVFVAGLASAQTAQFDSARAWEHLRQLVTIGPRPAGSPAIEQTRKYLKDQLGAMGVAVTEQAWDDQTPIGKVHMVNLIATIPGGGARASAAGGGRTNDTTGAGAGPSGVRDRLIIGGHYDTKLFRQFRFVGASDGGSSAAFLLELARVLKASRNTITIELLFLDGEEAVVEWQGTDHTYGSRHYVETAKRNGSLASLKAFILVDMIGNRDLRIRREGNSTPWLTDAIWDAAKRQKLDEYFVSAATTVEDDHLPFLEAGVPSVDIIDLDYPPWHTAQDNLDAVSARSLQVVGDALLAALPQIEARLVKSGAK